MQKIFIFILVACLSMPALAGKNPMFGENDKNSITFNIAQSTGSYDVGKLVWPFKWDISPQTFFMMSYAQPVDILRLPGRMNVSIMQNIAYESCRGLSFLGIGASWDISLFQYNGFYVGFGIGPYYRDNHDRWVSSRFVFGERVFIGKNFSEHWRGELFTLHFSNGDLTETNHGFNFFGIGANYSF